jgi:hypothetical protein
MFPPQTRVEDLSGGWHRCRMTDHPPLPNFGDELGLYRLVRWAKGRVKASAWPPAERAAILAEIEWQYRAAL